MKDAIGDVLAERARKGRGLERPFAASLAVHVGAVALAMIWSHLFVQAKQTPRLMTISLAAGAEGPRSTGLNPLSAKKVEEVAPPPKRAEPIKPVPPKNEAMTMPVKPKTEPKPAPKPTEPPKPEPVRPPTTGAEVVNGTARVETNVKTEGTGLSTGATLGGAQELVQIDPKFKFCCQAYIDTMCEIVQRNWDKDHHVRGDVVLQFTILRNGHITDIKTEKATSSALERYSIDALHTTESLGGLGKLPDEYKDDQLIVHLRFPYVR